MPKIVTIIIIVIFLVILSTIIYMFVDALGWRPVNVIYLDEIISDKPAAKEAIFRPVASANDYNDTEKQFNIKLPDIDLNKDQCLYLSFGRKLLSIKYHALNEEDYNGYSPVIVLLDSEYQPGKIFVYLGNKNFNVEGGNTFIRIKGEK